MSFFLIFWTAYLPIAGLAMWSLSEWLAADRMQHRVAPSKHSAAKLAMVRRVVA